jgi:hypothetical protein
VRLPSAYGVSQSMAAESYAPYRVRAFSQLLQKGFTAKAAIVSGSRA